MTMTSKNQAPFFELLINQRPVSHQAKNKVNLQRWKDEVNRRAFAHWQKLPLTQYGLRLTLIYLCGDNPADIDNIIKPIQDGLNGVVFCDDSQITDVDSHRRSINEIIDLVNLPRLLIAGILAGEECVYLRVSLAQRLGDYV